MIKLIQDIPGWADAKPFTIEARSLKELLSNEKVKSYLGDGDVFAYGGSGQTLMVSSSKERTWWVIGYVDGCNLIGELPHFKKVYKFTGNVKVVKVKPDTEFINCGLAKVDKEYIIDHQNGGSCMLTGIDGHGGFGWISDSDLEFIRYATQEELDKINNRDELDFIW